MRASQTFRVLLNAPVLKKMTVGDSRGKEPNGKFFSFGVVEDGILVPYLLKVSSPASSLQDFADISSYPISQKAGNSITRCEDCKKVCRRVEHGQSNSTRFIPIR